MYKFHAGRERRSSSFELVFRFSRAPGRLVRTIPSEWRAFSGVDSVSARGAPTGEKNAGSSCAVATPNNTRGRSRKDSSTKWWTKKALRMSKTSLKCENTCPVSMKQLLLKDFVKFVVSEQTRSPVWTTSLKRRMCACARIHVVPVHCLDVQRSLSTFESVFLGAPRTLELLVFVEFVRFISTFDLVDISVFLDCTRER